MQNIYDKESGRIIIYPEDPESENKLHIKLNNILDALYAIILILIFLFIVLIVKL